MDNGRCDIRIGASGWHYDHWVGRFYPEKLRKDRWFEYYAQRFDTVEIDNTLREWADWIKSQSNATRAVYAYFNNDVGGHAIHNAQTLKQFVGREG